MADPKLKAVRIPAVGSTWKPKSNAPRWCGRNAITIKSSSRKSVRFIYNVTAKGSVWLRIYTLEAFHRDYEPIRPVAKKRSKKR